MRLRCRTVFFPELIGIKPFSDTENRADEQELAVKNILPARFTKKDMQMCMVPSGPVCL
jgi:hypothetical protein